MPPPVVPDLVVSPAGLLGDYYYKDAGKEALGTTC